MFCDLVSTGTHFVKLEAEKPTNPLKNKQNKHGDTHNLWLPTKPNH